MNKNCYGKLPNFLLVILLFLTTSTAIGQGFYNTTNWRFSNPKQFGFTVRDVDFFDNNNGIAVGANGGIAYTTDGGAKWSYGAFTFMNPAGILASTSFQDVHFISATTAYAVGSGGCMAKSTNGGASWSFVTTPLSPNSKNINTTWFLNENKGYIGGEWNTSDSIPKVYFTNNGGASWDSLASPSGGTITRIGWINNVNVAPILYQVSGKGKEIMRIMFNNDNTGYVTGNSQHSSGGPTLFTQAVATTGTCLPTGPVTQSTLGAQHASLVWKFTNGTLVDYSTTKERMGYPGSPLTGVIPCSGSTGLYRSVTAATNSFTAMHIINDSAILLISSNNNTVIRVYTGKNDSTVNIATGLKERGRYEIMNLTNPPTGYPTIPATNPIFTFLNPVNIAKAANGKLATPVASGTFGPINRMMTTTDTGRTWKDERWIPTGRNYSTFGGQGIDILPSGKFVIAGNNGVVSDSMPGGSWNSTYVQYGVGSYTKMDFADCNNIIAAGAGFITTTSDGGKTWNEMVRQDLLNLNAQINSVAYVPNNPAKAYFATSVGLIFKSSDINAVPPAPTPTLDPVLALATEQIQDIATAGNDSVWACGQSGSSVLAANRSPKIFRSTNGGTTWTTVSTFPAGTLSQRFTQIEFPSRNVGYVCGSRDTVWKTTDGGVTWNKLPLPTPGVTPQITYTDMFALNDNTVFLVGNGFPRKVVFRTTDGGATWQEITGNILAIMPVSNLNSVVFHDANNGYVGANGAILVTNNGGTTWRLDVPPSGQNNTTMGFSPKKVPAAIQFANRKLLTTGAFGNHILEYGNPANVDVNSTEAIVASCTVGAKGSVVVNTTGGIAPYTYSLNGGTFQSSNTFSNLAAGNYTITIKDAFCGTLTKTVTVGLKQTPIANAGPDYTIVIGDEVTLQGSGATGASVLWTPSATLTNANTFTPVAKPSVTTPYVMTVTSTDGCIGTDNNVVTVIPFCLDIKNAFSPNGDGINDKWVVTNGFACTNQIYAAVYNRYGSLVYKNDNYTNNWDGTYNGKPVPDGTYYYVVTYKLINGKSIILKGDVTILR